MSRHHSLAVAVLLCALVLTPASTRASAVPDRPNIVVLLADDLGYGDISPYGHPTIKCDSLERMSRQGLRFTQFYSGAPICTPSRAALMTGRLPVRSGVYTAAPYPKDMLFRVFYPSSTGGLPTEEITIAKVLKGVGYSTGIVGKWHLGHLPQYLPTSHGFDYFYGLPYSQDEGCPPYPCHKWQHIWPGVPLYNNATIIEQPVNLDTLMDRYNDAALNFIENNKEGPFFLYMAYSEVHVPVFASPAFQNTSKRGLFGDALEEMDHSIGKILDKLEDLGLSENTLVLFTSDNGPWRDQKENGGSAGLLKGQKGETWEGGIRVPAIAMMPGKISAGTTMEVGSTMDFLPTAARLAGASVPTDRVIDGKDMSE